MLTLIAKQSRETKKHTKNVCNEGVEADKETRGSRRHGCEPNTCAPAAANSSHLLPLLLEERAFHPIVAPHLRSGAFEHSVSSPITSELCLDHAVRPSTGGGKKKSKNLRTKQNQDGGARVTGGGVARARSWGIFGDFSQLGSSRGLRIIFFKHL